MLFQLSNLIFPDYCCSCGKIGSIFCKGCAYDIISEPFGRCILCTKPSNSAKCVSCSTAFSRAFVVGDRSSVLHNLVAVSKFGSSRSGCFAQATLLDAVLPELPEDSIFVPIPTIQPHVRGRGFGHTERIARELSKRRNVRYLACLQRRHNKVQVGANARERKRQADTAFATKGQLSPKTTYILIDDVYTTGATVKAAAKVLKDSGADEVWIAITAYNA